jgi:ABC-type glycerol-3-phosphate transport system permease component
VLFCNWLISGFSVIVLSQAVRSIPRQLADSAKLDGCGWFGTYWHVLLPFVRLQLWLIGFLTLTGTSILLIGLLPMWSDSGTGLVPGIDFMMVPSLVVTALVIAVFLFAKGPLVRQREPAG